MKDLVNIRSELSTHTQAFSMFLNLLSIGSQGKVKQYMDSQGRDLREIKMSLNWVTASLQATGRGENSKSILTTYTDDDKETWKNFRRELIKEGFSHEILKQHKRTIREYRGALDTVLTDREDNSSEISDDAPCTSPAATAFRHSNKTEDCPQREVSQAKANSSTRTVGYSSNGLDYFQPRLVDLSSMETSHSIFSEHTHQQLPKHHFSCAIPFYDPSCIAIRKGTRIFPATKRALNARPAFIPIALGTIPNITSPHI